MEPWQFSPSSLNLLKECLSGANKYPGNGLEKKWVSLFKHVSTGPDADETIQISDETIQVSDEEDISGNISPVVPGASDDVVQAADDMLPHLSRVGDAQSVLDAFFNGSNLDERTVNEMYVEFLPAYLIPLSVESPVRAVDLIIKCHQAHPLPFAMLIVRLFQNSDVSTSVLKEFLLTVKNPDCTLYLQQLAATDMSKEAFCHHLNTLKYLYEKSEKSLEIQNFIFQCLSKSAEDCANNMEYGRLMHMFLQNVPEFELSIKKDTLERLVNIHQTWFKKVCSNICRSLQS